ncbi:SDR family NAD(P)-dependent oxidoreductase [Sciscionella sediminilitoris]|uniref:SDR family NAD(P)-dependent oxidoreductase n=1 Tax=Sciscionella sediminilitoris TaxID=1445613 RepID=UPI0004DF56ED|nr:SDR family NAD(P)-dependent oxidoreductase [Sciscionella sp. SE31]
MNEQVAVITGAAQGIGEATAWRFAEQGAKLVLSDIVEGAAQVAAAIAESHPGSGAIGTRTDVTDPGACEQLIGQAIERHGRLDVLAVASVTAPPACPLEDLDPREWDRVMAVNAKGPFLLCRSAIPHLNTPGGRIVFVHSAHAQAGSPERAVYSASKGALGSLIKSLALELAPRQITVNGVAPWHVEAAVNAEALRAQAETEGITVEEARHRRDSGIPLGRQATTREIADAIAFLAAPGSAYITGTVLDINGGMRLR